MVSTLSAMISLTLEQNSRQNIPSGFLDNCTNLKIFYISNNHLSYLPDDLFQSTTTLRMLDVCCNHISSLPSQIFEYLIWLEYLDLSGNLLTEIPSLVECKRMVSLKLSNNFLAQSALDQLGQLKHVLMLDLTKNRIQEIDNNIALEYLISAEYFS